MKLEIHLLTMWNNSIKFSVFVIFILFFCFATTVTFAFHSAPNPNKTVKYDSSAIKIKKIPSTELNKLHDDSDYSYSQVNKEPKTAWEHFKEWFWLKVSELFDTQSGNLTIKIIRYVFLLGAVTLIIFLILKNKTSALFYGKSASVAFDLSEVMEDIQEINFDKRILEEVGRGDFRRAIRLYFLKIIKDLNQQNIINWKQDKTNADYLKELRNSEYYNEFKELSRLYEYIWYGDFKLDEDRFRTAIEKFNQFKINKSV